MSGDQQHWTKHLNEMRSRMLIVFGAFVIMLMVGFFFAKPIIEFMKEDILQGNLKETLELHSQ